MPAARRGWMRSFLSLALALLITSTRSLGDELLRAETGPATLIVNTRVFDGRSDQLTGPKNVLVQGNVIRTISSDPIPVGPDVVVIDAGGRTLMPGLIDAHTHILYSMLPVTVLMTSDIGYINIVGAKAAEEMLLRGFTSVRDAGGPIFGLKKAIDQGVTPGPRIWPSGAFISQSGGHGDFRLPTDFPVESGRMTYGERVGGTVIADSPDEVRKRTRELLALGASQIKLMAGGGTSSVYDPIDAAQYTVEEIRAAVEAAENWGTYVTVHAYTPRAVRQAIEAGVRCIEHGQLLDEETVRLMAEKGVWWSLQPFVDDGSDRRFPEGSPNRLKQLEVYAGTDRAYQLAKKHNIRIAFGTDKLMDPRNAARQSDSIVLLKKWFTPAEILRMITRDNAELLALSGQRSPYPGKLGVIEEGALADLLVVDGNPLENIDLLAKPGSHLLLIMKDGRIYKNNLQRGNENVLGGEPQGRP